MERAAGQLLVIASIRMAGVNSSVKWLQANPPIDTFAADGRMFKALFARPLDKKWSRAFPLVRRKHGTILA